MHVLLIDDEPFYNKLLSRPMKEGGHEFVYSRTGKDGLAKISAKKPDLIIVDLQLPDMDGRDLLRALQVGSVSDQIPVIVMAQNSHSSDAERRRILELGAARLLSRPFEVTDLVGEIERVLSARAEAELTVEETG